MEGIEMRRHGKLDFYFSQISAQLEAGNTKKGQKPSNFLIPDSDSLVPRGWLDLSDPKNEENVKQAFRMYCRSMNKGSKKNG